MVWSSVHHLAHHPHRSRIPSGRAGTARPPLETSICLLPARIHTVSYLHKLIEIWLSPHIGEILLSPPVFLCTNTRLVAPRHWFAGHNGPLSKTVAVVFYLLSPSLALILLTATRYATTSDSLSILLFSLRGWYAGQIKTWDIVSMALWQLLHNHRSSLYPVSFL